MWTKSRIFQAVKYVFLVQILALFFFSIIRIAFIAVNFPEGTPFIFSDILHALVIGVRFDNHIASYISLLPLLSAVVISLFKRIKLKGFFRILNCYYYILYTIAFLIAVSNIRYFAFFGWHINIEAFSWFRFFDTTAGMLVDDKSNYPYLVMAPAFCALFIFTLKFLFKKYNPEIREYTDKAKKYLSYFATFILAVGICFIGMRGSFQRYVIKVSFASFSDIPFYNRIGNNALFNIVESIKQTRKNVDAEIIKNTDTDYALSYVTDELEISDNDTKHPINRNVTFSDNGTKLNVILVLMESMTLNNLSLEYNGRPLTPFLRELRDSSIYFENFYSAGIHTNNGMLASMYGYSPNFLQPCMNQPSDLYTGLPYWLKKHGYKTYTFVTSNPQYDNMNSFLLDNNIDRIYSQYDYPNDKIVTRFGVRDDYLFEYGTDFFNNNPDTEPFFAMFLTCSNHSPYSIPEKYSAYGADIDEQAIAYADDALKEFFEKAKETSWGKNSVFVFVADHGSPRINPSYDMAYFYNRIPCYIYSEAFKDKAKKYDVIGGQIDLFPTIMGMLQLDYVNNTLGVDLLEQQRKYIYFVSDEHLGCADKDYFYCYNINSKQEFLYKIGNTENIIDQNREKASDMRDYAVNMMKINNTAVKEKWINAE